ncbi:MAG: hypothetical protein MZU97_00850 [Bacillus subtilis]|nr:hypothetical protein [Bacillus subtilis]
MQYDSELIGRVKQKYSFKEIRQANRYDIACFQALLGHAEGSLVDLLDEFGVRQRLAHKQQSRAIGKRLSGFRGLVDTSIVLGSFHPHLL